MGWFRDAWKVLTTTDADLRRMREEERRAAVKPAPPRKRKLTVEELAVRLRELFPDGIEPEVLWTYCERAGLPVADVDRRMDELGFQAEQEASMRPNTLDIKSMRRVDLRAVESMRAKVTGIKYAISYGERSKFGSKAYALVPEPENKHDPLAVAVYARGGRRVGYVSAGRAAMLAPLLAEIDGDAFIVGGTGMTESSSSLWVDLPRIPALRKYVAAHAVGGESDG